MAHPPAGQYHTVTPYLTVSNAAAFVDFVVDVFGGQVSECITRPDGSIAHADIRLGDSTVMLSDATAQWPAMPGALYVYVHDCDDTYARALAHGGFSLMAPADQFHGDRMGGVRDAQGNVWWIVTHLEDVPAEELQRRADAARG